MSWLVFVDGEFSDGGDRVVIAVLPETLVLEVHVGHLIFAETTEVRGGGGKGRGDWEKRR